VSRSHTTKMASGYNAILGNAHQVWKVRRLKPTTPIISVVPASRLVWGLDIAYCSLHVAASSFEIAYCLLHITASSFEPPYAPIFIGISSARQAYNLADEGCRHKLQVKVGMDGFRTKREARTDGDDDLGGEVPLQLPHVDQQQKQAQAHGVVHRHLQQRISAELDTSVTTGTSVHEPRCSMPAGM